MRGSVFAQFDTTLSVLVNNIASDIWLATGPCAKDSIVATLSDPVLPNVREAAELIPLTSTVDPIGMALFNQVLE